MMNKDISIDQQIQAYSPSRNEILDAAYKGPHVTVHGFCYVIFDGDTQWSIIDIKHIKND